MAYEKQTWVTGETITAEKLNHMEDGIASGGYNIIFTQALTIESPIPVLTADGASLEELLSSGEKRGSFIINVGTVKSYMQSINCQQHYTSELLPYSAVGFTFFDINENATCNISLNSNGDYEILSTYLLNGETKTISGTYTYSNGHYVFTPDESGT